MNVKTWLAGTAFAALMAANTASAGELYIANLRGSTESPPTTAPYTGTGYLVLNNANTGITSWFTHDIPAGRPYQGQIERADGSAIQGFPVLTSPGGPFQAGLTNPAADVAALRAGNIFMNFYTTDYVPGAIRGAFSRYTFTVPTTNLSQAAVAIMLNASPGNNGQFDDVLVALAKVPTANQAEAYNQMSGRTLYSQSVQVLDSLAGFQNSLFSHANDTAPDLGTFNFYVKGAYSVGKRDETRDQAGASSSRPYVIAGIDTAFIPNAVGGIAVAYADGTDKFRNNLGSTSVSTIAGLGYVSLDVARVVLQGMVGYGKSEIATTREMALIGRTATSRHNGNGWLMAARLSMPYTIAADTTFSPYLLLDTQNASIDSYTEVGAASAREF